jgi:hypothetical protein
MSRALSTAGGAALTSGFGVTDTDFASLFQLTALCTALLLAPLPLLLLVPPGNGGEVLPCVGPGGQRVPCDAIQVVYDD